MTKFIFENKDKKKLKDCSDEEMLLILKSKLGEGVRGTVAPEDSLLVRPE